MKREELTAEELTAEDYCEYCDKLMRRYADSEEFARIVDWMTRVVRQGTFTPANLVDAANMARILSGGKT